MDDGMLHHVRPALPSRGVAAWLPFLWSRVLFPGTDARTQPARTRSLLILLFLPGVLLYGCLSFHLFEPDEGRYAEIPREMLARGEWIVPYLQAEPYLDKPPLLYWLVRLSYMLFGVHDWAARLVPAMAVHLTILISYLIGRRSLGERAAFWGALLLSLAPGFVSIGRLLILDGLLTLWVGLSVLATWEAVRGPALRWNWWLLAAVACGLGVLTKGPVALLLMAPPVWATRRLAGTPFVLRRSGITVFALVVLAIALPWYVAICVKLPAFARYFLWEHNVVRFLSPFDHQRPIWFYGPVLLGGLLPATILLPWFLRFLLSGDPATATRRSPSLGFMLLAGGWCVLFFSLSGCKLPTYILPAFPPLALALGYFLTQTPSIERLWPRALVGSSFLVLCLGHNVLLPWYAGYRGPVDRLADMRSCCTDPNVPLVTYPRHCDSVAFYVGRDDLRNYRSKETNQLIQFLRGNPRSVLLLTHRHSLQALQYALPADLQVVDSRRLGLNGLGGLSDAWAQRLNFLMGETSLGLADIAVIEKRPGSSNLARLIGTKSVSFPAIP